MIRQQMESFVLHQPLGIIIPFPVLVILWIISGFVPIFLYRKEIKQWTWGRGRMMLKL